MHACAGLANGKGLPTAAVRPRVSRLRPFVPFSFTGQSQESESGVRVLTLTPDSDPNVDL